VCREYKECREVFESAGKFRVAMVESRECGLVFGE